MSLNTQLTIVYRDHDNYKISMSVVVRGEINQDQLEAISGSLVENDQFIPHQVGLPTPVLEAEDRDEVSLGQHWHELEVVDHPLHLHTEEAPSLDMSIDELARAFADVTEWNEGAEMRRLGLL